MLDEIVTQQAAMIAYLNDFKLLMMLTLAMIPLVLIIRAGGNGAGARKVEERGDRLAAPRRSIAFRKFLADHVACARRARAPRHSGAALPRVAPAAPAG